MKHMKRVWFAIASMALSISTAAVSAQANEGLTDRAMRLISEGMKQPNTQFRNVRIDFVLIDGHAIPVVCGEYNARNFLGMYVGFRSFMYEPTVLKGARGLSPEDPFVIHEGGTGEARTVKRDAFLQMFIACRKRR